MTIKNWLEENVTQDDRALSWFDEPECEPRIVKAYSQLLEGYNIDTSKVLKPTRLIDKDHNGTVTVGEISFYSICAHHFLPFYGKVSIKYLPGGMIIGLGKFPRLVAALSRRFQIQEDLVREVAKEIMSSGEARGVYVKFYCKTYVYV